ncbi:unnamed protein product [Symbiodinium sp. CCMP2456]|nr:unnamed protein product [Symbiodinium sp. CCMP2456]
MMARSLISLFAFLLALAAPVQADVQQQAEQFHLEEFLAVTADATQKEQAGEAVKIAAPEVSVADAQEIELHENPYVATSTTAEGLALIFMMVSCVICYLECCK